MPKSHRTDTASLVYLALVPLTLTDAHLRSMLPREDAEEDFAASRNYTARLQRRSETNVKANRVAQSKSCFFGCSSLSRTLTLEKPSALSSQMLLWIYWHSFLQLLVHLLLSTEAVTSVFELLPVQRHSSSIQHRCRG